MNRHDAGTCAWCSGDVDRTRAPEHVRGSWNLLSRVWEAYEQCDWPLEVFAYGFQDAVMRESESAQGFSEWRWGRVRFGQDRAVPVLGQKLLNYLEQLRVIRALARQERSLLFR